MQRNNNKKKNNNTNNQNKTDNIGPPPPPPPPLTMSRFVNHTASINTIIYFDGVIVSQEMQAQIEARGPVFQQQCVNAFQELVLRQRNWKHLKGQPGVDVISIHVNYQIRIDGFPIQRKNPDGSKQQYGYPVDCLPTHNYQDSRALTWKKTQAQAFINSPAVQQDIHYSIAAHEQTLQENDNVPPLKKSYTIKYFPVHYNNNQFFVLNPEQKELVRAGTRPLLLTGPGNVGKTTVADEYLDLFLQEGYGNEDSPIYFVSNSEDFINLAAERWRNAATPSMPQYVFHKAYKQVLEAVYPAKKILTTIECKEIIKTHLTNYLKDKKNNKLFSSVIEKLNVNTLYDEFIKIRGYSEADYIKLSRSPFSKEQKQALVIMCDELFNVEYKRIYPAFTPVPGTFKCACLILDEVQNFPKVAFNSLVRSVDKSVPGVFNVVIVGDFHQLTQKLIDPLTSSYISHIIAEESMIRIEPILMTYSNQCSRRIAKFANKILEVENIHIGGRKILTFTQFTWHNNGLEGDVVLFAPDDHKNENILKDQVLLKDLQEKVRSFPSEYIVITLPEFRERVRKIFPGPVLTVMEVQGRHFENVIACFLLDTEIKEAKEEIKQANQLLVERRLQNKTISTHKPADLGLPNPSFFPELYVASMRGRNKFYWMRMGIVPGYNDVIYEELSSGLEPNEKKDEEVNDNPNLDQSASEGVSLPSHEPMNWFETLLKINPDEARHHFDNNLKNLYPDSTYDDLVNAVKKHEKPKHEHHQCKQCTPDEYSFITNLAKGVTKKKLLRLLNTKNAAHLLFEEKIYPSKEHEQNNQLIDLCSWIVKANTKMLMSCLISQDVNSCKRFLRLLTSDESEEIRNGKRMLLSLFEEKALFHLLDVAVIEGGDASPVVDLILNESSLNTLSTNQIFFAVIESGYVNVLSAFFERHPEYYKDQEVFMMAIESAVGLGHYAIVSELMKNKTFIITQHYFNELVKLAKFRKHPHLFKAHNAPLHINQSPDSIQKKHQSQVKLIVNVVKKDSPKQKYIKNVLNQPELYLSDFFSTTEWSRYLLEIEVEHQKTKGTLFDHLMKASNAEFFDLFFDYLELPRFGYLCNVAAILEKLPERGLLRLLDRTLSGMSAKHHHQLIKSISMDKRLADKKSQPEQIALCKEAIEFDFLHVLAFILNRSINYADYTAFTHAELFVLLNYAIDRSKEEMFNILSNWLFNKLPPMDRIHLFEYSKIVMAANKYDWDVPLYQIENEIELRQKVKDLHLFQTPSRDFLRDLIKYKYVCELLFVLPVTIFKKNADQEKEKKTILIIHHILDNKNIFPYFLSALLQEDENEVPYIFNLCNDACDPFYNEGMNLIFDKINIMRLFQLYNAAIYYSSLNAIVFFKNYLEKDMSKSKFPLPIDEGGRIQFILEYAVENDCRWIVKEYLNDTKFTTHSLLMKILLSNAIILKRIEIQKIILANKQMEKSSSKDLLKRLLEAAIICNDQEKAKFFFNKTEDIATLTIGEEPVLHYVLMNNHLSMFNALLESYLRRDLNINQANRYGYTLLHLAAEQGEAEIVCRLLTHNSDINQINFQLHQTALHFAAGKNHIDTVKCLLEHDASPDFGNTYGWTPLHCATEKGHIETIKLLLEKIGPHFSYYSKENHINWVLMGIVCGNVEIMRLIDSRVNIIYYWNHFIISTNTFEGLSIRHGLSSEYYKYKKQISEEMPDLASFYINWTPLHFAVFFNKANIFSFLLEKIKHQVQPKDLYSVHKLATDLNRKQILNLTKNNKQYGRFFKQTDLVPADKHSSNVPANRTLTKTQYNNQ